MELQELRRRLLLTSNLADIPPPLGGSENHSIIEADHGQQIMDRTHVEEHRSAAALGLAKPTTSDGLAFTVERLFEPTKVFYERFARLYELVSSVDAACDSSEQALKDVEGLCDRLAGLSKTFHSVKVFAEQVKQVAVDFAPMKTLQDQLDPVIQAFDLNIRRLSTALEPARVCQPRIRQLENALRRINSLEKNLQDVADKFSSDWEAARLEGTL